MLNSALTRCIALAVPVLLFAAQNSSGQAAGISEAALQAALLANAMRATHPAKHVLSHKVDLSLTAEQIQLVEARAKIEEDSASIRGSRVAAALEDVATRRKAAGTWVATDWTGGAIDEKLLREQLCETSEAQTVATLSVMYDRRAVGAILTPAQVARMAVLEASDKIAATKAALLP